MYRYIYICITCIDTYIYMYLYNYLYRYIYTCIYTSMMMWQTALYKNHKQQYIYIYTNSSIYINVLMYIYICIYIYVFIQEWWCDKHVYIYMSLYKYDDVTNSSHHHDDVTNSSHHQVWTHFPLSHRVHTHTHTHTHTQTTLGEEPLLDLSAAFPVRFYFYFCFFLFSFFLFIFLFLFYFSLHHCWTSLLPSLCVLFFIFFIFFIFFSFCFISPYITAGPLCFPCVLLSLFVCDLFFFVI